MILLHPLGVRFKTPHTVDPSVFFKFKKGNVMRLNTFIITHHVGELEDFDFYDDMERDCSRVAKHVGTYATTGDKVYSVWRCECELDFFRDWLSKNHNLRTSLNLKYDVHQAEQALVKKPAALAEGYLAINQIQYDLQSTNQVWSVVDEYPDVSIIFNNLQVYFGYDEAQKLIDALQKLVSARETGDLIEGTAYSYKPYQPYRPAT